MSVSPPSPSPSPSPPRRPAPAARPTTPASSSPPATSRPPTCASPPRSRARWSRSRSHEGDAVAVGQEIARIDTTDTEPRPRSRRGPSATRPTAELRLRLAGARAEDIAELEAQVGAREADLAGRREDLDRMQGLLDLGLGHDEVARRRPRRGATWPPPASTAAGRALRRLKAGSRAGGDRRRGRARVAGDRRAHRPARAADRGRDRHEPGGGGRDREARGGGRAGGRWAGPRGRDRPRRRLAHRLRRRARPRPHPHRPGGRGRAPTTARSARAGHLHRLPGRVHAQERADPRRAGEARLPGEGRASTNDDGLFKPGMPAEARLRPPRRAVERR